MNFTDKEKLLIQAMEIENEARKIEGKELLEIPTEKTKTWQFQKKAKMSKVYELRERIEHATKSVETAKLRKAERTWLLTTEGKAYTSRLNEATEKARNIYIDSEKTAIQQLNQLSNSQLGERWGLIAFSDCFMKYGIIKENEPMHEDGTYNEVFGHSFEIWVEDYRGEERFDLNYGSLGSFNPTKDVTRVKYLQGLAKFVTDVSLQKEVARIHREFIETNKKAKKELEQIQKQNPYTSSL